MFCTGFGSPFNLVHLPVMYVPPLLQQQRPAMSIWVLSLRAAKHHDHHDVAMNPLPLQEAIASTKTGGGLEVPSSAEAPGQSRDQDVWLDTALEDTFPASDPISIFHADDAIFIRESHPKTIAGS